MELGKRDPSSWKEIDRFDELKVMDEKNQFGWRLENRIYSLRRSAGYLTQRSEGRHDWKTVSGRESGITTRTHNSPDCMSSNHIKRSEDRSSYYRHLTSCTTIFVEIGRINRDDKSTIISNW
jgi:hypothetical protein